MTLPAQIDSEGGPQELDPAVARRVDGLLSTSPPSRRHAFDLFCADRRLAVIWGAVALGSALAEAASLPLLAAAAVSATGNAASVPVLGQRSANVLVVMFLVLVGLRTVLRTVAAELEGRIVGTGFGAVRAVLLRRFGAAPYEAQVRQVDGARSVTSVLITSCGRIVGLPGSVASGLNGLAGAAIMVLAAAVVSWRVAGLAVGVGLLLAVAVRPLARVAQATGARLTEAAHGFFAEVNQLVRTLPEVRSFGVESEAMQGVFATTAEAASAARRATFVSRLMPVLYQSVVLAVAGGMLALLANTDLANTSELAGATLLLVRALNLAQAAQESLQQIDEALPQVGDIVSCHLQLGSVDLGGTEPMSRGPSGFSALRLRDATYCYPDGQPGVEAVTMRIARGEILGVIGKSGAGKSTLLELMLGLREPTAGSVTAELRDREIPPRALAAAGGVAYVRQRAELIAGSVADNVRFHRDLTIDDVCEALEIAAVPLEELGPEGVARIIGSDGLSGGQAQRIALARGLVRAADLLVLDEVTSALDTETEGRLIEALRRVRGPAVVLTSHRPGLLAICDRIAVMDAGRIVAIHAAPISPTDLDRLRDVEIS